MFKWRRRISSSARIANKILGRGGFFFFFGDPGILSTVCPFHSTVQYKGEERGE
jgi:hypothetical protein